jgi:hypothetical protein
MLFHKLNKRCDLKNHFSSFTQKSNEKFCIVSHVPDRHELRCKHQLRFLSNHLTHLSYLAAEINERRYFLDIFSINDCCLAGRISQAIAARKHLRSYICSALPRHSPFEKRTGELKALTLKYILKFFFSTKFCRRQQTAVEEGTKECVHDNCIIVDSICVQGSSKPGTCSRTNLFSRMQIVNIFSPFFYRFA